MAHYESYPQRITPEQLERYWQLIKFLKAQPWAKHRFQAETEKELRAKVGREIVECGLNQMYVEVLWPDEARMDYETMTVWHNTIRVAGDFIIDRLLAQGITDPTKDEHWQELQGIMHGFLEKQVNHVLEMQDELTNLLEKEEQLHESVFKDESSE